MEFTEDLQSRSAPKIKKAAIKIAKAKHDGYEELLLSALECLIEKPKSWQAQSEVIKALGLTGSSRSLPYLTELEKREFQATVLYKHIAFSICMINDINNKSFSYLESILDTDNDLLLAGACSALLLSGKIPDERIIKRVLDSVITRDRDEGQVITPRCYIAAACYTWPNTLTTVFLETCSKSSWSGLQEIAMSSLAGKKSKYVLV